MDSDYENEEVIVNFEEESGNLTNEEEMEKENGERVEFNTKGRKKKPKKDDSYKTYSYGDIVMFIGLVEEREEIWNPRNKDWHRNEVRKEKFAEVEQLCKRFMPYNARCIGKCAKERWDELSKDYASHMMRLKKIPSGSGTEDVRSNFRYSEYLNFLCVAKKSRETKISHCIGSIDNLVIETPKRKLVQESSETPKPVKYGRRTGIEETIREEMAKTRETFEKMAEMPAGGEGCKSERICKVFESVVAGKSAVDRFEMEGKVVSFISSLRGRGGSEPPTTHLSHSSIFPDHNLLDLDNYGPSSSRSFY